MNRWWFLLTATLAAFAAHFAVQYPTPIDEALPLIAVIVTVVAAVSYPSLMLAVPLLVVAEIAVPDEGTRLLAFGVVVAAVFAFAMAYPSSALRAPSPLFEGRRALATRMADEGSVLIAIAAIVLLRWIPLSEVRVGREIFLLGIAALIVLVLDRTPFAMALAVTVVLITPAIPLRTLLLPLAVLFVAVLGKIFGMPKVALRWPSLAAIAFVMLFFAWSGVVARAFPYLLKPVVAERPRSPGAVAMPARASALLAVPAGATTVIVSGANVAQLSRGTAVGTIEPGHRVLRIGDVADWGYTRREHFYGTRNPLPRDPAGRLRGHGYAAWVDGAGRVPLPPRAQTVRITADASLPPGALLQVEGFE